MRPLSLLLLFVLLFQASHQLNIDYCNEDLGLENGLLGDDAFTASSSYDPNNVGPKNARLHNDGHGGAWCPREPVSKEKDDQWIQVNLTEVRVISAVLTQGRFAGGQGQEYAQAYRLLYWRRGLSDWKEYRDSLGRTVIPGNEDTYSIAASDLSPPIVASAVRLLPHSNHSRTVCLRLGLRGCAFTEGVESYTVLQGQVRGSTLELLDITYDGVEDSVTGVLSGGLGQLVDGKYGSNDFKATGDNGIVKGYEWLGWRNRTTGPLQIDFTFDRIRSFRKVSIHVNNHYSRDIQIFSRAKIYFSNEEGKFGDDRAVDFLYMPDTMIEEARNVTINLHGEHGKYVMVQLYFAAKWILVSEITFESEIYEERPFLVPGPGVVRETQEGQDIEEDQEKIKEKRIHIHIRNKKEETKVNLEEQEKQEEEEEETREVPAILHQEEPEYEPARYVGLIIGVLLTLISVLLACILLVIYRGRVRGKETPTHSLLASKLQDKISAGIDFRDMTTSYTPYKAKMRVYGHVSGLESNPGQVYTPPHQERLYSAGFPSLSKKFRSDPVLSDCTEDYAEPNLGSNHGSSHVATGSHLPSSHLPSSSLLPSASLSDNIYSMARPPSPPQYSTVEHSTVQYSTAHYSTIQHSTVQYSEQPLYTLPHPPKEGRRRRRSKQHLEKEEEEEEGRRRRRSKQQLEKEEEIGCQSSLSSAERLALECEYSAAQYSALQRSAELYSAVQRSAELYSAVQSRRNHRGRRLSGKPRDGSGSSKTSGSGLSASATALSVQASEMGSSALPYSAEQISALTYGAEQRSELKCSKEQSNALSSALLQLPLIPRSQLKLVERVGRGRWGEVHLCHLLSSSSSSSLVAVKSLDPCSSEEERLSFLSECVSLSSLQSPHLASLLGVELGEQPLLMVTEAGDLGDLNQYLQDHVAESSLSKSPGVATLSYPALLYMATQVASGIKSLESIGLVHRDLATRNILVFPHHGVKIADCGAAKPIYSSDYCPLGPGGKPVPLRWMAWESLLLDMYTTASDVWSYGVTLWEILTFCREQPYEAASDEKVVENLSTLAEGGEMELTLTRPYNCPREVFVLMTECWSKSSDDRPSPTEIELFLLRKNLGFRPEE